MDMIVLGESVNFVLIADVKNCFFEKDISIDRTTKLVSERRRASKVYTGNIRLF